jgi:hypothetical protein
MEPVVICLAVIIFTNFLKIMILKKRIDRLEKEVFKPLENEL